MILIIKSDSNLPNLVYLAQSVMNSIRLGFDNSFFFELKDWFEKRFKILNYFGVSNKIRRRFKIGG